MNRSPNNPVLYLALGAILALVLKQQGGWVWSAGVAIYGYMWSGVLILLAAFLLFGLFALAIQRLQDKYPRACHVCFVLALLAALLIGCPPPGGWTW